MKIDSYSFQPHFPHTPTPPNSPNFPYSPDPLPSAFTLEITGLQEKISKQDKQDTIRQGNSPHMEPGQANPMGGKEAFEKVRGQDWQ